MAIIVNTIVGDQQLELRNEELIRRMSWGSDWRSLRVGLRWSAQMDATLTGYEMVMGFNGGTTYGYRSANCVEFMGTAVAGPNNANWTYNAGGGTPYFATGWYRYYHKVGATTTTNETSSQNVYGPIAPTRGLMWFSLYKGNGIQRAYTVWNTAVNAATAQVDYTTDDFYRMMEVDYVPPFGSWASVNYAYFEYAGNYDMDSVLISWNNAISPILISDMMVVRYY